MRFFIELFSDANKPPIVDFASRIRETVDVSGWQKLILRILSFAPIIISQLGAIHMLSHILVKGDATANDGSRGYAPSKVDG